MSKKAYYLLSALLLLEETHNEILLSDINDTDESVSNNS